MMKTRKNAKRMNTIKPAPDPLTTTCRMCGSTDAELLRVNAERKIDGTTYKWVRVRCGGCGQIRVDRIVS